MVSENHVVFYSNNIILIHLIMIIQKLEYLKLHTGLILKLLFVLNNFKSNNFIILMIETFDSLSKAARAKKV
jgi:hypothetical protein